MGVSSIKKAAILNSRQTLRPLGSDQWVNASAMAVADAVRRNYILLTSIGMKSWEIILTLASRMNARLEIIIPVQKNTDTTRITSSILNQFHLNNAMADWIFVELNHPGKENHDFQTKRDRIVFEQADILYPVSIRTGGNMDRRLSRAWQDNFEIIENFRVEYNTTHRINAIDLKPDEIDSTIDNYLRGYLVHWTRASNSQWPDETAYDFHSAIIDSENSYPRRGIDTLIHILQTGTLIASSRHYRENISAVAFSSLLPTEAVKLMRWRARYSEMTFEPYGIAIREDFADTIGIKKVFYGSPEMHDYLTDDDKPYFQNIGTVGYWMPEKEYRHLGNINLNLIPREDLIVIVRKPDEIEAVRTVFNGKIRSLGT